jgi:hypothetical protein
MINYLQSLFKRKVKTHHQKEIERKRECIAVNNMLTVSEIIANNSNDKYSHLIYP